MSGITSPPPFIKDEPDEFHFSPGPQFTNSFNHHDNQAFGSWAGANDVADSQTSNGMPRTFSSNNMSSSFIAGNSGVTDDDLMASLDLVDQGNALIPHAAAVHAQANLPTPQSFGNGVSGSLQMQNRQQGFQQGFSNTPDGQPISSPFVNGFDFAQWQPARHMGQMQQQQQQQQHQHQHQQQQQQQHQLQRQQQQQQQQQHHQQQAAAQSSRPGFDKRTSSISKSPMTPMTPGVGHLQIGTPDSGSFPSHGVAVGHRKSSSQQWDNSIGSAYSYIDSPLHSPNPAQHPQISEVLNKGSSLPASAMSSAGHGKTRPSVEDKKARRRASHNEVERKRRNNINNQITTLSRLVPTHRLEDDNIRRALNSNTSLPPSVTGAGASAGGMSPPQATSLLAGGTGRRATGAITQGLPLDEKDKAPAKGDVLNSSVGWTRDLMWLLNRLMHRESVMQETIESLGGQVPIQISDEENRMRTELLECFQRNSVDSFEYSRRHGSNLWVPGHTDPAGLPVSSDDADASAAGVSAMAAMLPAQGTEAGNLDHTLWTYTNDAMDARSSLEFKEEDEYINMDM